MCEYKVFILIGVFVCLAQLPTGNGLECAQCTTKMNPECADLSKVATFETCNGTDKSVCRTFAHLENKEVHLSRGCYERETADEPVCTNSLVLVENVLNCEVCDTDFCNTNQTFSINTLRKDAAPENFNDEIPKANVISNDTTPQHSFSTVLRSSFHIVIVFIFINFFTT